MRVDSHDMYRKIGFFDPESGIIREAERSEVDVGSMILCGHYSRAGGMLVVFYRVGEGLRLWLAGRDWAAEPSLVSWSKKGSESSLEVRDRAGAQAQIRYQVEECKPYDDTPFAEDEDFDFGLYVINVLNDPGRRARMYQELFAQYVNAMAAIKQNQ